MNPISFACSHCSQSITVPPEAAGRAVPCPNCKQATLAPLALAIAHRDLGPDFSETLRRARESTDSIFNEQDEESDSLFGGSDTPRKPILPSAAPASVTPSVLADAQQTTRVPGLPDLPPIRTGPAPTFVPDAASKPNNPFEDLAVGENAEASAGLQPDEALEDEEIAASKTSPSTLKNLLILALAFYGAVTTVIAIWGWVRTPTAKATSPAPFVNKR